MEPTFLPRFNLNQLDFMLGMNQLKFNHVHVNYFDKTVIFPEIGESGKPVFISAKKVEEFLKDDAQVFVMFSSLRIDSKVALVELPVICNFSKVFPDDISDLLL